MNPTIQVNKTNTRPYQQCTYCVMDTTASDIVFDEKGQCNYCTAFIERFSHTINEPPEVREARLNDLVNRVKKEGRGKSYDCIVGVSGGVDSSWALVQAVRLGLRPLAVHMDNGWNSELAQNNIANLVRKLDVDLYTHVIDWDEYKGLMQSFFDADVIDVELLYDNAMLAVNYQQAKMNGIKFILSGSNEATEGMAMPTGWNWYKFDKKNIYGLAHKYGKVKISSFPAIGVLDWCYFEYVKRIRWVNFLDYMPYNKSEVLKELEENYGYTRYPFKHYESVFTRFYQGYILPRKFNVDKRLVHLATLVASGQMTRADAIKGLEGIPYPSEQHQEADVIYFLKKMGWTRADLEDYLSRPGVSHDAYPSERSRLSFISKVGIFILPKFLQQRLKKIH